MRQDGRPATSPVRPEPPPTTIGRRRHSGHRTGMPESPGARVRTRGGPHPCRAAARRGLSATSPPPSRWRSRQRRARRRRQRPCSACSPGFAPEAIPLALADAKVMPEAAREAAVAALHGVSLLAPAPDGACGPAVSLHRLVQAVMRARLARAPGGGNGARWSTGGPGPRLPPRRLPGPRPLAALQELMTHVRTVLQSMQVSAQSLTLACISGKEGNFLHGSGAPADALCFSRRALAACKHVVGPEHADTLTSVDAGLSRMRISVRSRGHAALPARARRPASACSDGAPRHAYQC